VEKEKLKLLEKVKVEGNKVQLLINPAFYDFDSVVRVKKEFEQVSQVVAVDNKSVIFVEMKPLKKISPDEMEMLGYEFYNHLLNEVKEMEE
jgi:hypothetical protein